MSHDRDELREKMLAYYLGALGTHEAARIRELVRSDSNQKKGRPVWSALLEAGWKRALEVEDQAGQEPGRFRGAFHARAEAQ